MQEQSTTSFLIVSSLAVLVASVAAANAGLDTWLSCDAPEKALDSTGTVVLFAGLVLPLAIFLSHWWTKALVSVLGLGAAIYAGAVVVLAVQGATYSQTCGGDTKSPDLDYLYVFWGGALLTLLVAVVAVLNEARGAGSGHTGVRSGPPTNRVPQH